MVKRHVTQYLDKSRKRLEDELQKVLNAECNLESFNGRNAHYRLSLHSCWSDYGEQDVTHEHEGSIKQCVEEAEQEFLRVNKRSDVQADGRLSVKLGDLYVPLPQELWEKYRMRKD